MTRDDDRARGLASTTTSTEEDRVEQRVYLDDGRQVAITRDGSNQAVEIRAASGQLELRIRMTQDGPVLSLEGVKLELRSASAVDIQCETFNVTASQAIALESAGTTAIKSAGDLEIESADDVRVVGKTINLN